jgi:hypothetical protein
MAAQGDRPRIVIGVKPQGADALRSSVSSVEERFVS